MKRVIISIASDFFNLTVVVGCVIVIAQTGGMQ
jgi:hypothetical protein